MVAKRTVNKKNRALGDTPGGNFTSGLIMLVIAYILFVLATDSGSLLLWAGTVVGLLWGLLRIGQGLYGYLQQYRNPARIKKH